MKLLHLLTPTVGLAQTVVHKKLIIDLDVLAVNK